MKFKIFISIAIILCALLGTALLLDSKFSYVLANKDNYAQLIYILLVTAVLFVGLFRREISASFVLKSVTAWSCVILVLISAYSYKAELRSVAMKLWGNIVPGSAQTEEYGRKIIFYKDSSGHFMVNAKINNSLVRFLVDTGATNVLLTQKDAKAVGIDVTKLKYDIRVNTANGVTNAAYVLISKIEIASIVANDVSAYISPSNEANDISLLGMSFLNKLKGYEIHDGSITFYK